MRLETKSKATIVIQEPEGRRRSFKRIFFGIYYLLSLLLATGNKKFTMGVFRCMALTNPKYDIFTSSGKLYTGNYLNDS